MGHDSRACNPAACILSCTVDVNLFINRWSPSGGAERANYQQFLSELCEVIGVPRPDPTKQQELKNAYVFEKSVPEPHGEGKSTIRRIDLYKRGCFVLEAKQGVEQHAGEEQALWHQTAERRKGVRKGHGTRNTAGWDQFMQRAKQQAEAYVRLLPEAEGRPPFILVVDVGYVIEVYAEFTCTGGVYRPFPSAKASRITLDNLRAEETRTRLKAIWLDPLSLDPAKHAAAVTKQVANMLAGLTKSLEAQPGADGQPLSAEQVSGFLIRMIFTMFAEDVGLIPEHKFRKTLEAIRGRPEAFAPTVRELWGKMASGGYSVALQEKIKHFNGGLFEDVEVLELTDAQLELFIEAAKHDWAQVEPSIFGALVERALNPRERHKLGAHYTPRAYVERLVEQVVIKPLEEDWKDVLVEVQNVFSATVEAKRTDAVVQKARGLIESFLVKLRETTVLDPACGTGNFLYVSMELMKRLEAEVVETFVKLGGQPPLLGVAPGQFYGLEVNPRAAKVAELVLWIGYLQLCIREHGRASPPEPILKAFHNIRQQDAVLSYSGKQLKVNREGKPATRWDGASVVIQPSTGRGVPDPNAVVQDEVYKNSGPMLWPRTNFIVGNPPFVGAKWLRDTFGNGYAEALWKAYPEVPESADFVMFWWYKAAQLLTQQNAKGKRLRRFGFVTTNSLKQTFNRRVLERFLGKGSSLAYAVPDHPWVDEADGAAVRVAMTVVQPGSALGVLTTVIVIGETASGNGEYDIRTQDAVGVINSNLTLGVNVVTANELEAMEDLSNRGVQLFGSGFIIPREKAAELGLGKREGLEQHIREYRNGKDLTNRPRDVMVIDLFGLTVDEVRDRFPEVYQHVLLSVKPERDQNNRSSRRERWWIFGETNPKLRKQLNGLPRYIATVETSKYRFFQFLDASVLPDNKLIAIAHADAYVLGVLSSRIHVTWALAQGGTLEDRPRYNKTRCFETFPFPDATEVQKQIIRELAERLDAFRKERLAEHPKLTMTALYNVLEKLRGGEVLTAKDRQVHDQGVVTTLKELHDELDSAVAGAFGLSANLDEQAVLDHLVRLNAIRAAEEKGGRVRYLRPDYQNPGANAQEGIGIAVPALPLPTGDLIPFPQTLAEQARIVRQMLSNSARPLSTAEIAGFFTEARSERVEDITLMLVALGQARQVDVGTLVYAA